MSVCLHAVCQSEIMVSTEKHPSWFWMVNTRCMEAVKASGTRPMLPPASPPRPPLLHSNYTFLSPDCPEECSHYCRIPADPSNWTRMGPVAKQGDQYTMVLIEEAGDSCTCDTPPFSFVGNMLHIAAAGSTSR